MVFGYCPFDNNDTEREIRERAAMMYSFFGACKVKGKNPERWLTYEPVVVWRLTIL